MSILNSIENWVIARRWYIVIIAILLFATIILGFNNCNRNKEVDMLKHNIEALNDTIHTYHTAQGNYVSQIKGYITELSDLKHYNAELAQQLADYKKSTGSKPVGAVNAEISTVLPERDTVYIVETQTPEAKIFNFDFSDKYRYLTGNVRYQDNNINLHLNPERVFMNLTAGLDEKNNVFVMTDNPYVEIQSLQGFTVPKTKQPRWSVSVTGGMFVGYDIHSKDFGYGPGVMVGVSYNLFNIK